MPVLMEDMYLDPVLFSGIDGIDMAGRSLSQIAEEKYYLRPTGGKQNFRIIHLTGRKAGDLSVSPNMPVLLVKRFLDFPSVRNAVFSELICRTDQFVFSQIIGGGMTHEKLGSITAISAALICLKYSPPRLTSLKPHSMRRGRIPPSGRNIPN